MWLHLVAGCYYSSQGPCCMHSFAYKFKLRKLSDNQIINELFWVYLQVMVMYSGKTDGKNIENRRKTLWKSEKHFAKETTSEFF